MNHPLEGPRWGLAVVRGTSMEPTLRDGDRLLVRYVAVPRRGQVAVVRFTDGVLAVKRLEHHDGDSPRAGWWVTRDNPREGRDSWSAGTVDVVGVTPVRVWPRPRRLGPGAVRP
ncbi:S24 family peptidase [Nocardioides marmoraquaticus]